MELALPLFDQGNLESRHALGTHQCISPREFHRGQKILGKCC